MLIGVYDLFGLIYLSLFTYDMSMDCFNLFL